MPRPQAVAPTDLAAFNTAQRSEDMPGLSAPSGGAATDATSDFAQRPPGDVTATERVTRMLYLGIGAASLIFGALSFEAFLRQYYVTFPIAATIAWLLLVGLPAALGFLSHLIPLRVLRRVALTEGGVFLFILSWWLIKRFEPLPFEDDIPWVLMLSGIPTVTIAIIARPWTARAYAVLASLASGLIRAAASAEPQPILVGIQDGLYMLLLSAVLVGLTLTVRRGAARVDSEEHIRRASEAEHAAGMARRAERRTINALVHDSVLSTLLMAGLNRASPIVIARQARQTLDQLDALDTLARPVAVSGVEFADQLRTLCREQSSAIVVTVLSAETRSIPAPVTLALLGAAGEALRNSLAAAGVGHPFAVHRRVTLSADARDIHLAITDDGVGFNSADVPEHRLGIRESIIGRIERLEGGRVTITSQAGQGTCIDLFWVQPAITHTSAVTAPVPAIAAHAGMLGDQSTPRSFLASLGLSVHIARSVVVLFILVHSVLAAANSDRITMLPLGIFAFLLLSSAAIVVTGDAADPIPRNRTMLVLLLCTAAATLMYFHIPSGHVGAFAHWHLGAISLVLVVLIIRGRPGYAWIGYAVMALGSIVFAVQAGQTVGDGLILVSRHAGTVLAGTVFAVGMRYTARILNDLNIDRAAREKLVARADATISERRLQLARLNAMARPSLERLASIHPVTDMQRGEFLLVEAGLRDGMRARRLFVEPIIGASWAARARGVQVVLLDDSGDRASVVDEPTAAVVADELERLSSGRLTVRLLPPGRQELATMMVESFADGVVQGRLQLISRDGTILEG